MRKLNKLSLILVLALAMSSSAFAKNQRCGVGTMIFGKSKSIASQLSENTTNRSSSGQASISYGTSGCKHNGTLFFKGPSGFGQVNREEQMYANANYEELMREMSQGKGEVLQAFAETLGCEQGVWSEFYSTTRTNYTKIFDGSDSPDAMLINVKKEIQANPTLNAGCKAFVI